MGALVGALAGIWLALRLPRTRRCIQRSALAVTGLATFGAVAVGLAGYPWLETSGTPVINYELRLPAGLAIPKLSEIDLTIWSGKNGHCCFIREMRMTGEHPEITGSIVLDLDNLMPTVSLALHRKAEGVWRPPYKPELPWKKASHHGSALISFQIHGAACRPSGQAITISATVCATKCEIDAHALPPRVPCRHRRHRHRLSARRHARRRDCAHAGH